MVAPPTPDDLTGSSGAGTFGSTAPSAGLCLYYTLAAAPSSQQTISEPPPVQTQPCAADLDLQTWSGDGRSFSEARGPPSAETLAAIVSQLPSEEILESRVRASQAWRAALHNAWSPSSSFSQHSSWCDGPRSLC